MDSEFANGGFRMKEDCRLSLRLLLMRGGAWRRGTEAFYTSQGRPWWLFYVLT